MALSSSVLCHIHRLIQSNWNFWTISHFEHINSRELWFCEWIFLEFLHNWNNKPLNWFHSISVFEFSECIRCSSYHSLEVESILYAYSNIQRLHFGCMFTFLEWTKLNKRTPKKILRNDLMEIKQQNKFEICGKIPDHSHLLPIKR